MSKAKIGAAWDASRAADALAAGAAAALPWSTSASLILMGLWLIVLIPTLDWPAVRRELFTPAGGLPVALFALGVIGMAWADTSWNARVHGVDSFLKLLVIPLLIVQFRRSPRASWVLIAYLASCTLLLAASYALAVSPWLSARFARSPGVPVRDYIAQSEEFVLCAFALLPLTVAMWRAGRAWLAAACVALAVLFLVSVVYVATGRTALVIAVALCVLYGMWRLGWKGAGAMIAAGIVVAAAAWTTSPRLRDQIGGLVHEVRAYEVSRAGSRAGERLEFWRKSAGFVIQAPVIGHGTGMIPDLFRRAAAGQTGVAGVVSTNPHNQTFAVAIQLGAIGAIVLWAMWIAHLLLFWRAEGPLAWIGVALVSQNIVGSLFNSHLFDFAQGWTYALGVGVVGGLILRERSAEPAMTGNAEAR